MYKVGDERYVVWFIECMYYGLITFLLVQGTALWVTKVRKLISATGQSSKPNKILLTIFVTGIQMPTSCSLTTIVGV
jgi:hypothetical protein